MTKRFILKVYEPGSRRCVLKSLESDMPFLSFTRGDTLNHLMWKDTGLGAGTLVIKEVLHVLWDLNENHEPNHMICLYTDFVEFDENQKKAEANITEFVSYN
ncbi:MAG: hypothetical protein ABIK28_25125 [Planctomycetota bacterium]